MAWKMLQQEDVNPVRNYSRCDTKPSEVLATQSLVQRVISNGVKNNER